MNSTGSVKGNKTDELYFHCIESVIESAHPIEFRGEHYGEPVHKVQQQQQQQQRPQSIPATVACKIEGYRITDVYHTFSILLCLTSTVHPSEKMSSS